MVQSVVWNLRSEESGGKKGQKCRLRGSEVRFRAAKKAKSVIEEFRSGVQGGEKGQQCCRGGTVERRGE